MAFRQLELFVTAREVIDNLREGEWGSCDLPSYNGVDQMIASKYRQWHYDTPGTPVRQPIYLAFDFGGRYGTSLDVEVGIMNGHHRVCTTYSVKPDNFLPVLWTDQANPWSTHFYGNS